MSIGHTEALDGVALEIELDQHGRFVADHVAIVAGRNGDDVRSFIDLDATVGIRHVDAARYQEPDVCVHAVVGANVWTDIAGPLEPGRIDHALDPSQAGASDFQPDPADIAPEVGATHIGDRRGACR